MVPRLTGFLLATLIVGAGCRRTCDDVGCEVPLEFLSVTVGEGFSCGLATAANEGDVGLLCWGANVPAARPPMGVRFTEVAAGDRHACGTDQERGIHCWGEPGLPQIEAFGFGSYQFL